MRERIKEHENRHIHSSYPYLSHFLSKCAQHPIRKGVKFDSYWYTHEVKEIIHIKPDIH
jgi:hypothetical protein